MNITKYPIVHEDRVICEVDVPCTDDGKTTNETRLVIDAALQVRTAMLRWHNEELRSTLSLSTFGASKELGTSVPFMALPGKTSHPLTDFA